MGFECVPRQTTADFLTSLTSPSERRIRVGFEARTPRTAEEFVIYWKRSNAYAKLRHEIREYEARYPLGGQSVTEFTSARRSRQAHYQYVNLGTDILRLLTSERHVGSPYTLSISQQISLCVERGFQRLKGDASVTISSVIANSILALIVGKRPPSRESQ
jgi:ATP-binding cassette subfamily G (WHITE) protein 2 (PDR)